MTTRGKVARLSLEERRAYQRAATQKYRQRLDPEGFAARQKAAEMRAAGWCKNGHPRAERGDGKCCIACKKLTDAAWLDRNREKKLAKQKEWTAKNAEKHRANARAWRKANPERNREAYRAYQRKNAAKFRFYAQMRQAARKRAIPSWFDALDLFVFEEASDLAARRGDATGFAWEIDHIVPLKSDRVCGLHCAANVSVIPASENARKHNRYWPDM